MEKKFDLFFSSEEAVLIVSCYLQGILAILLPNSYNSLLVMVIMKYCMRLPGKKRFKHDPRVLEYCIVVIIEENRTERYGVDRPDHAWGNGSDLEVCHFQRHKSKS